MPKLQQQKRKTGEPERSHEIFHDFKEVLLLLNSSDDDFNFNFARH